MPRISPSLLRRARTIDCLLPALLGPCRDLHTAHSELRWLREHVERVAEARVAQGHVFAKGALLRQLVKQRASGKPLQYILGTEYFGHLELRCRPGVLIPRQDTAASVAQLAHLLHNGHALPPELRLLDLCTGSGCIPLLFRHELYAANGHVNLRSLGVDVSDKALQLANYNMKRTDKSTSHSDRGHLEFIKADVLMDPIAKWVKGPLPFMTALKFHEQMLFWDILISNPPYISPSSYWKTTTRSVRGYEPKLALVPPECTKHGDAEQGDMFYPRLLCIAQDIEAKIVLLEVADLDQALRVAQLARTLGIYDGIEIWRESPNSRTNENLEEQGISVIGEGNARSVLCWRGVGSVWLGKATPIPSIVPVQP
ncbi:S-adenosyl-L-methionine-dependent methyltransferase [Phaeosphaeriaceae sp. PMI808]|nr:S-adenosyl-L-methionine-dependent methyltransferase [Phaeosphaeriaceae sp. PMI808]